MKKTLKAGALVYAIFIMLITLIVIGTLITIAYYHRTYIGSEQARQNLVSYTNSILTAAMADSTLSLPWDAKSLELTENEKYSFNVTKQQWGGYHIYTATSSFAKFSYEKKVLCGAKGVLDDNIALYLADNNNAISISGNTQLIGNCYLPKSGIKAAYMEGDYYRGKKLVYGDVLVSSNSLPAMNSDYLASVTELLEGKVKTTDSIVDFAEISSTEFTNSFYKKTLYFVSKDSLYLNNCKFAGNIVIITDIEKGSSLHQSLQQFTVFDNRMVYLIKVGEEVNQLDRIFEKLQQQYAADVEHQVSIMSSLLEPILIIGVGLLVGIILIAMYLPLFQISNSFM